MSQVVPQTILLVDDEFSALEVLAFLLRQEGYDVITASDGEDALSRLCETRCDLVVTDFWMPRLTGLELFERMQAEPHWREIPVLLMTAAYDSEAAHTLPFSGVIAKPMTFLTLLDAIRRVLPS